VTEGLLHFSSVAGSEIVQQIQNIGSLVVIGGSEKNW